MADRPNILFLLSDEHSYRCLGHCPEGEGGEPDVVTPTLDGLAAAGTVFTDTYCQMPLCTPSRISLLTGLAAQRCGAWTNQSVLRPELNTMAKALGAAGYETCLVGKMHLGGTSQSAGFNHRPYGDLTGRCGHQAEPIPHGAGGMRGRTRDAVGVTTIPESLMQENNVAIESLAFLREHRHAQPQQPWLLCASFSRPHFPLTAPQRWIDRYDPARIARPKVPASGDAWNHPMSVGMRAGFQTAAIGDAEMMRARAAYFACVSYLDELLGDFLGNLAAAGLLDNTIIVYTTDHGEMAGEHGMWWKNGWFEGCTRVPFIVSTPAQRRGDQGAARVRTPVALLDLFPTFCGLAGAPVPADLDGIDLTAAVTAGAEPPARPIYCDNLIPRWGDGTEFRSVRAGRYKVVVFKDAPPLAFDLVVDPGEQHNLLRRDTDPETRAELTRLLDQVNASIDWAAVVHDRTVRDADLDKRYPDAWPPDLGNLYHLPDGRLVDADAPLYHPREVLDQQPRV